MKKMAANRLATAAKNRAERDRWIFCAGFIHQPQFPQKLSKDYKGGASGER